MTSRERRCEKDVPLIDSIVLLIEFPNFLFRFSANVEVAEDVISFTDLLVYFHFAINLG